MSGGRIRTLKPEILDDQKTSGLSHEAFRLFIGLITLADDYGNTYGDARKLSASVFWARECLPGVSRVSRELLASGLIQVYTVRGQEYVHICGWGKHQRVDKPGKPRVPGPELGETIEGESDSRESREDLANVPGSLAPDQDQEGIRTTTSIPTTSANTRAREEVPLHESSRVLNDCESAGYRKPTAADVIAMKAWYESESKPAPTSWEAALVRWMGNAKAIEARVSKFTNNSANHKGRGIQPIDPGDFEGEFWKKPAQG